MKRSVRHLGATMIVVAGVSTAWTGSAVADPSSTVVKPSVAAIQALAAGAISARLSSLNSAITDLNANTVITSPDRSTLLSTLDNDVSGLTALATTVKGDTTLTQVTADYKTVFTTYRVYALALPQARYAAAADDLTVGVLPRLTSAQSTLQGLLSGAESGKNAGTVASDMTDLASQISAITTATDGLTTSVLAFTPAQYDANPAILSTPHQTLAGAYLDAGKAGTDIADVVAALQ